MIEVLGQTQNLFPAICDATSIARKRFSAEGVTLIVPSLVEDRKIRWVMDQGMSISEAYNAQDVRCGAILPPVGMRACVSEVLRTKYYDRIDQGWKISPGGNWTCIAFGRCFADYLSARRRFEEKRGRIKIADGVYGPSPAEEECIMNHYTPWSKNLEQAYADCDASDILPQWPGAVESIAAVIDKQTGASLYEIISTLYKLSSAIQPPVVHVVPHRPAPEKPEEEKKRSYLLPIGIVVLVFLLTR